MNVVNDFKWHYKLQWLFCGAIYKQLKCKKRAVPLINEKQRQHLFTLN